MINKFCVRVFCMTKTLCMLKPLFKDMWISQFYFYNFESFIETVREVFEEIVDYCLGHNKKKLNYKS